VRIGIYLLEEWAQLWLRWNENDGGLDAHNLKGSAYWGPLTIDQSLSLLDESCERSLMAVDDLLGY
jgi:hypothetical protein